MENNRVDTSTWRVLVVEDQEDSVQVVSQILEYHGIEVHVARDGQECVEMLNEVEPTLVITDLAMPKMDGWETLAAIRRRPTYIPVVAVTAYHSVNVAQDALRAGFDAYFPKPIEAASFVRELERIVSADE
jgi:CheY-like chemotaxis protein